jgi:catechol 2,3-dioxygenase-like lactoylglutathione lyase family enzyme
MLGKLAYANVWVDDQDEALAFYIGKLGMELREDITLPELGNFRWLAIGMPGQDVGIALMLVPPAPIFDAETREQLTAVIAKGVVGALFFVTDDCRGDYERLRALGVEFTQEPTEVPYGIDAGFRDPFGNHHRLTQRS